MNIGQSVWHCKKLYENGEGIIVYDEPKEYILGLNYLTINQASGYIATLRYGEQISKVWSMKAKRPIFDGIFAEGDVMYVDGASPDIKNPQYINGDGANALITECMPILVSYSIALQRIEP